MTATNSIRQGSYGTVDFIEQWLYFYMKGEDNRLKKLVISFVVIAIVLLGYSRKQYKQELERTASAAKGAYEQHQQMQAVKARVAKGLWEDKNWYVIGDSLTTDSQYQTIVQQDLRIKKVTTDAQPRRQFAFMDDNLDVASLKEADLITVFGGTHDYGANIPLGQFTDDENTDSFYGHIKAVIKRIKDLKKDDAKLVLITPIIRGQVEGVTGSPAYPDPNLTGYRLEDYVEAIIEVGHEQDIQVINLFSESGITLENIEEHTKDQLHLNEKGDALVSEIIAKKLLEQ